MGGGSGREGGEEEEGGRNDDEIALDKSHPVKQLFDFSTLLTYLPENKDGKTCSPKEDPKDTLLAHTTLTFRALGRNHMYQIPLRPPEGLALPEQSDALVFAPVLS